MSYLSFVQKFIIPGGTRLQVGGVRPQTFQGIRYEGGGNQVQILDFKDRAKLITVGKPRKIC
jgi:putative rhs protein